MNIKKLELTHFGKFHLKTITFTSGLNIVYGKNEAGKSTIHAFVRSMLFGIPDTEEGNERYQHYLPWETPHDFCGRMWIKKDDKIYRIERNFLRPQPTVRVYDDKTGESLKPAKQHLRQILSGLTETSYLNTICIEQLKSVTDPQLAKELQEMAVNASQSKNMNIDVDKARQELLLKKQSLESQIVNDVDSVHQKNQKMADESGKRLSRLQRSRYIREKQSSDLQTQIQTERRQAEEELMAYERERDELRRRYESDKKASEAASGSANLAAKSGRGWLVWLLLAVVAGVFSIYRYQSVGMTNRSDFWMITIGMCAAFVCLVAMFVTAWKSKDNQKNALAAKKLSSELTEKLSQSLKAFEECKTKMPQDATERCKPLEEQYEKAQRELTYLVHQQEEEEKILLSLEENDQKLKGAAAENARLMEEIESVNMALKTMAQVSERIRATFGNLLNNEASKILFDITDGKYEKLVIGQDMKVRVYADEREVALESVSRGTIEQIYLSIRVAAAKLLWQDEPMPFLFDDVFAYYDDDRLAAAINMLKKCGHQVIVFSCHSREDSLLG